MLPILSLLIASQAMAGSCPTDDEVVVMGGAKTAGYVVLGNLEVVPTESGLTLAGLDDGDDRVLELADGVASFWSPSGQQPIGAEVLGILDRGEAGDNVIFDERSSLGFTADDVVLQLDAGDVVLTVFTGPAQIAVQATCDDGSTLGVLLDSDLGEAFVARDQGGELLELGTLSLGTGWGFPPTLHSLNTDGSVKTVSLSAVSLDDVNVDNGTHGTHGLKVTLEGAKIGELAVDNVAKLEVDADSSVERLDAADIGACTINGTVSSYIGETEKNLSVNRNCSTVAKVR